MTAKQRTVLALSAALLHVGAPLWLAHGVGLLEHFADWLFVGADQREYRDVGSYLLGLSGQLQRQSFELRPILFPLYLVATLQLGPHWFLAAQLTLLALSVFLLADTLLWLFESALVLTIALLFTLSSVTLLMSPYHAMTETMSVLLISAFVFFYTRYSFGGQHSGTLCGALLALALACIVKGIFLPFFVLFMLLHLPRFHELGWRRSALILLLVSLPLVAQLTVTAKVLGRPLISDAGRHNFSWRFYPLVYGLVEQGVAAHYASPVAAQARAVHADTGAQLRYVLGHPAATWAMSWWLWQANFERGEGFYEPGRADQLTPFQYAVFRASMRIDRVVMGCHMLLLPLLALHGLRHWRRRDGHYLLVLLGFVLSIFLSSILVYFQGDRIVLVTLPVVALGYPALLLSTLQASPAALRLRAI
jgi:hypothetical protein